MYFIRMSIQFTATQGRFQALHTVHIAAEVAPEPAVFGVAAGQAVQFRAPVESEYDPVPHNRQSEPTLGE